MDQHERYMRIALEEAAKGRGEGNHGVGSVIVREGSVIARGRNLVASTKDPTAHAETAAIREAGPAVGQTDLSGCTLYTTLQPCPMCCGAIIISGIDTLVIGARHSPDENRWGDYRAERLLDMTGAGGKVQVVDGVLERECSEVRY